VLKNSHEEAIRVPGFCGAKSTVEMAKLGPVIQTQKKKVKKRGDGGDSEQPRGLTKNYKRGKGTKEMRTMSSGELGKRN